MGCVPTNDPRRLLRRLGRRLVREASCLDTLLLIGVALFLWMCYYMNFAYTHVILRAC